MALSNDDKQLCSKYTILLDYGHGKDTGGKRSPAALYNQEEEYKLLEYKWAREEGEVLKKALEACGFNVFEMIWPEDNDLDVNRMERCRRANAAIAGKNPENCISISIHINACGNIIDPNDPKHQRIITPWSPARGWCVYYAKETPAPKGAVGESNRLRAKMLSENMFEYVKEYGLQGNRYHNIFEKSYDMVYFINCPAILTENLFMTNKEEVLFLKSLEGKRTIAEIHLAGILKYIGVESYVLKKDRKSYKYDDNADLRDLGFID